MKGWWDHRPEHSLAARGMSYKLSKRGEGTVARIRDSQIEIAIARMYDTRYELANSPDTDPRGYASEFVTELAEAKIPDLCAQIPGLDMDDFSMFSSTSMILATYAINGEFQGMKFSKNDVAKLMDAAIKYLTSAIHGHSGMVSHGNRRYGKLPGGLSEGKKVDYDPHQIVMGQKVEMEHTKDPEVATEIAMDHLTEDPRYYTKLKRMEEGR